MRIWLDDERPMPDYCDLHIKTAEDLITIIENQSVEFISFDHDLGSLSTPEETGYTVAKRIMELAYLGLFSRCEWAIHSRNPVGCQNICACLCAAELYWSEWESTGIPMCDRY